MTLLPLPALLADVGGTFARFAVVEGAGDWRGVGTVETASAPSFEAAAARIIAQLGKPPRSAIVDAAGPVHDGRIALTNAAWVLDAGAIARALGFDAALLLNDFEALALALPHLPRSATASIGPLGLASHGTRLVLGPGTGLGAAAVVERPGGYLALPSEAGHIDFGPANDREAALWPLLERCDGRLTAECVLAGPGLPRLYRGLCRLDGKAAAAAITSRAIVSAALEGADATAREAALILLRGIARLAGDLALVTSATGGVAIAGGMAQRLSPLIDHADFRRQFEAKAPFGDFMRGLPTVILTSEVPAFAGLAAVARAPERHLLDAGERIARA